MEIKKNMVFEYCDKDDYMKYFIPKKYNAETKSWWGLKLDDEFNIIDYDYVFSSYLYDQIWSIADKTLDTCYIDDFIISYGSYARVLEREHNIVYLTDFYKTIDEAIKHNMPYLPYTIQALKQGPYQIVNNITSKEQFHKQIEISMDEIAKKFGVDVEDLKIKKE